MRIPVIYILACAALCLFPVPPTACQAPQPHRLSDGFAVEAIRTLRMIQAEAGGLTMADDGSSLLPAVTNQAIIDLDAEARTKDELATVRLLKGYFGSRAEHNTQIHTVSELAHVALITGRTMSGPIQIAEATSKSPTVANIRAKDAACGQQLEEMLRSRQLTQAPACSDVSMVVQTPAKFDGPVPAPVY